MASPYQQQVFQRKLLYIGLILVLFTASLVWRRGVIDDLAGRLAIREESRGDVEVTGAAVRLSLTGLRGLATCVLWNTAIEKQKKNQWNELEVLVRLVTKLQPHFITPWLFQSWNLSYNVSVESDRVRDKYFYICRGIQLLAGGERQNLNHPDLRWSIGFYMQNKIMQSDETNVQRSLFQLSLIPPAEREPALFRERDANDKVAIKADEMAKFCRNHAQLVRRLRQGIHRDVAREKRVSFEQFTCQRPEDVVQFLEDNWDVPSLYAVPALKDGKMVLAANEQGRESLPAEDRFPVLPPAPGGRERPIDRPGAPANPIFDKEALNDRTEISSEIDSNLAAHAWYSYAQEPIPPCGEMPGSTQDITNRALQRKPRYMTTLIFRHYPAQARRFLAERLQQEGWFDKEGWSPTSGEESGWEKVGQELLKIAPSEDGKVGGGREWALDAWTKSHVAWQQHGQRNKIWFPPGSPTEQNMRQLARRYWDRQFKAGLPRPPEPVLPPGERMTRKLRENFDEMIFGMPLPTREEKLGPQEKEELYAAQFMFEWKFYRQVSNFDAHYQRSLAESRPETVAVRKMFFQAEEQTWAGDYTAALHTYETPVRFPGSKEKLSPLMAWRKLVLLQNRSYRDLEDAQTQSAEVQIAYLSVYDRVAGKALKKKLSGATILPELPPTDFFPLAIVAGPFDGTDDEGEPLINQDFMDRVLDRKGLRPRNVPAGPPPGTDRRPPRGP